MSRRYRSGSLPFVLAATDHGPLIVSRFDRNLQASGTPYGVGFQLLETGAYDPEDIDLIIGQLNELLSERGPGLVAIDAGANIGVVSLEMARFLGDQGSVLSFEAQERLFYALAGNIALGNLFNITARHAALGLECDVLYMPAPDYRLPGSYGSLELRYRPDAEFIGQAIDYNSSSLVKVPLFSVDALALDRCDFIKVDVEGMELEVLRGAEATLRSCRPRLWIEWIKSDKAALLKFLEEINYVPRIERGMNLLACHRDDDK